MSSEKRLVWVDTARTALQSPLKGKTLGRSEETNEEEACKLLYLVNTRPEEANKVLQGVKPQFVAGTLKTWDKDIKEREALGQAMALNGIGADPDQGDSMKAIEQAVNKILALLLESSPFRD